MKWASKRLKGKALISILLRVAWNAFVYHIWRERNYRIFQQKNETHLKIMEEIIEVIRYRLVRLKKVEADELNVSLYRAWGLFDTIFH